VRLGRSLLAGDDRYPAGKTWTSGRLIAYLIAHATIRRRLSS
jgi:hypothetical protein